MDTLADTLAEAEAVTLGDTSTNVEADKLVETLAYTLGQTEAKRLGQKMGI